MLKLQFGDIRPLRAFCQRQELIQVFQTLLDDLCTPLWVIPLLLWRRENCVRPVKRVEQGAPSRIRGVQRVS